MNPNHDIWARLASLARRSPVEGDTAAPYGFATRVAALALAARALPPPRVLLEKFAWRGLFAAGAFSAAAVAFGFSALTADDESDVLVQDVVAEILAES